MAEFSRRLELKTAQELYPYLNGKSLPGNKLQSKLRDLGCDIEWLMTGERSVKEGPTNYLTGFAPYLGRVYADPKGKEYFEEAGDREGAGVPMSPGKFFCLEIDNDSLINAEPISLYPGDVCVFEYGRQPKNGDIVAIQFSDGNRTIKIVKHRGKDLAVLISANKFRNYPEREVKKADIKSYGIFVEKRQMSTEQKRRYGIK